MTTAWFIDGAYAYKCWQQLTDGRALDYRRFRLGIEKHAEEAVGDAYYFGADNDPPSAAQDKFHRSIAVPAPNGPGLRVKLYWLQTKKLYWPAHLGGQPVLHPNDISVQFELKAQKGVDVGLAFHLMRSFAKKKWNKLYLVAGVGDFHEVIQHLVENEDVEVVVIGTRNSISAEIGPYSTPLYFENIYDDIAQ